jgi:hypothetical protein
MPNTITPNMNLILPTPGQEPGPQYAFDQNQSGTITDAHNHSPGSGVQINPSGLNISTNLSFQNNSPTDVGSVVFSNPGPNSNLTTLYTNSQSGGGVTDLFYNDGAGNVIALTKAGEVNATIASLPGESYAGGTFTWKQGNGSTTPANFDIGSVTIRPNVAATTNGVVLGPPSSISSQYNIQLPTVPIATSFLQIDPSGNMAPSVAVTGGITSTNITPGGIVGSSLANGTITNVQIASETIIQSLLEPRPTNNPASAGQIALSSPFTFSTSVFSSAQTVTGASVTITTTGRPVIMCLQADPTLVGTTTGQISMANNSSANLLCTFYALNITYGSSSHVILGSTPTATSGNQIFYSPSEIYFFDYSITGSPGTYTYELEVQPSPGGAGAITVTLSNCVMVAYEI